MLPNYTNEQIVTQLDSGSRWYAFNISYGFPLTSLGIRGDDRETAGFRPLDTNQQAAARLSMRLWGDLISPELVEVDSTSLIRFGLSNVNTDYAHAYFPPNGSIWFNADDSALASPEVGDYGFETYLHEIGHALGLNHMGDYNGEGDNRPSCYEDSTVYSIMSYFGPEHYNGEGEVAWAQWVGADGLVYSPQTPMLSDIISIQSIYGENLGTRKDDTVYGFNSNINGIDSEIFDFSKNLNPILTIYDAGGTNTIDLSRFASASNVDLTSGGFSSFNQMTNNLAIAYNTIIHNVVCGDGADSIVANSESNRIDGGMDLDEVFFNQDVADYVISANREGFLVKDTLLGTVDILLNIEAINFTGNDYLVTEKLDHAGEKMGFAIFSGDISEYRISVNDYGVGVVDAVQGRDGVQILRDFERAMFNNAYVGFDTNGISGKCYRLYRAAFDREPDLPGLGSWINYVDRGGAFSEVAAGFVNSKEFSDKFGSTLTDENFVSILYNHTLHREPEKSGYDAWVNVLKRGFTRADVLNGFSESPENLDQVAELIANGIQYEL